MCPAFNMGIECMLKINKADVINLNRDFGFFRKRAVKKPPLQTNVFIGRLNRYEREYKKAGMVENFADTIFVFAENLAKSGMEDFAGIIYSSLMKLPIKNLEVKEKYALRSLEFYEKRGDSIHALSRMIDLKKIYTKMGKSGKYVKMLFREEAELKKICANFKTAKQGYNTYKREENPLARYEIQLAHAKLEIAKVVKRETPDTAKVILEKSKKIFSKYSREKEVAFIDLMLSEIK